MNTMKQLLSVSPEVWNSHDLRRVESCFHHFSRHHDMSQVAAKRILELWEQAKLHGATGEMYSHAIQALAKHGHVDCARRALEEFVTKCDGQKGPQTPKATHVNAVLQAYARNREPEQAEALLRACVESHSWPSPTVYSVAHVLTGWSRVGNGERAQSLLEWAKSHGSIPVNLICHNSVLIAWARSSNPDRGTRAEYLLRTMPFAPDRFSLSAVLRAWASSSDPRGIQRAEQLLSEAIESGQSLDESCLNILLHALSRLGEVDRAMLFLKRWIEAVANGTMSKDLVPGLNSFNIVLYAIVRSGRNDVGDLAQALYQEMLTNGLSPDIYTFNGLLHSIAKSSGTLQADESTRMSMRDVGQHAEALFDDMIRMGVTPDSMTYNSLLNVYAKSGNAHMAQHLLDQLEDIDWKEYRGKTSQRIIAYNTVLNAWVNYGRMKSDQQIKLKAAEQTRSILLRMLELGIQPDEFSYSAVLHAQRNCDTDECAEVAEAVLFSMEEERIKPKKIHYAAATDAWISQGDPGRAYEILKRMETMFKRMDNGGLRVHTATYESILIAFDKKSEPESAEAVLAHMEESDLAPPPPMTAYLATLSAWANSTHPRKALRSWQVFERMRSRVDTTTWNRGASIVRDAHNAVIAACSSLPPSASDKAVKEVLDIAFRAYEEGPQPDQETRNKMLEALANLVADPDELEGFIRKVDETYPPPNTHSAS